MVFYIVRCCGRTRR